MQLGAYSDDIIEWAEGGTGRRRHCAVRTAAKLPALAARSEWRRACLQAQRLISSPRKF
jgi:hypothetical protein